MKIAVGPARCGQVVWLLQLFKLFIKFINSTTGH